MRCCVIGCKNDSRHISKAQGITFHVFPNEQTLRTAWLKALGKDKWEPKERSAICSEHFLCEDLYETRNGLRKVKVGAVPFILQDSGSSIYGELPSLMVCRICLISCYGKMISLNLDKFKQSYEHLTGLAFDEDSRLPEKLCSECAVRLINHSRFRSKSLRSHSIMMEILKKQQTLTEANLATVNRENNLLTSPLKPKHYEPDYYDLHINFDDEVNRQIPIKLNVEVEIKNETEADDVMNGVRDVEMGPVNERSGSDIAVGADGNDDANADDDAANEDYEDVTLAENDKANENEDVHFNDHDTDSMSDDSLPLVRTRLKKKSQRNKSAPIRKKKVKKTPIAEPKIDRRRKPFLTNDPNDILFTITELTVHEQMAEIEKRQESANYRNAAYRCSECYKGYLDEDAYNGHMTRHTIQCGEYKCSICKTHFKNQHALRKHITAHHTQRFSCNQCSYTTTHRQSARLHERWHKGTKYQCPHCQDEFVKFTTYMGHIRIKHPSDFVCELCGFSFVSAKGIELHKKLKHRLDDGLVPEDGPYCELCDVRFISPDAHRRHLNVSARHITTGTEKGREPNKPKAKKVRKSKEAKEKEKREREKKLEEDRTDDSFPDQLRKAEEPIPCEQCGLQLEDSRAYHSHFRRMHPDKNRTNYPSMKTPCMCELCGRMFQSQALLKDHRWVHTGERPFKCDLCDKSFRMKQRLVSHKRVHAHARAHYACELCGKNFSTQSNRQRHMFIHTGLKPFKCEMCGKGFKHVSEKRTHVTYVHLKKPWPKRARSKRRPDSRQCQLLPNVSGPANSSQLDTQQSIWPTCDPKLSDINTIIEDKHNNMYYNLKV